MMRGDSMRRTLLRSLAALPVAAILAPGAAAASQASKFIVFSGLRPSPTIPTSQAHVIGWAAQTPTGWVGRVVDGNVALAEQDWPGFAAGATLVTPAGTENVINGFMDSDGVRGASVCFSDVTDGTVTGSFFRLTGHLTHAESAEAVFVLGDPISVEGNADAGEFTFTIRAAGRDVVVGNLQGWVLMS
jgi:hypothetical protein